MHLKYEHKMKTLREDMDRQRREDIGQIEKRKEQHVEELREVHERTFKEIKEYYSEITSNNLEMIRTLKDEVYARKRTEAHNEKAMFEVAQRNKKLTEPLAKLQRQKKDLEQDLANYIADKDMLQQLKTEVRSTDQEYQTLLWEHEVLFQRFEKLEEDKNIILNKYNNMLQDIQKKSTFRRVLVQKKLELVQGQLEGRDAKLTELLKRANVNAEDLKGLQQKVHDLLSEKDKTIEDLKILILNMTERGEDIITTYHAYLENNGISAVGIHSLCDVHFLMDEEKWKKKIINNNKTDKRNEGKCIINVALRLTHYVLLYLLFPNDLILMKQSVSEQNRKRSREDKEREEDMEATDGSQSDEESLTGTSEKLLEVESAPTGKKVEFSEPSEWVERMALTSTRPLPEDLNANDDPKREEAFIQQTLLSVQQGLALLEKAGVPCRRPSDYYAEMYKSDTHMNDVRQAMEASKARIEAQAHRRSMKDQKKYGKEVQAEVLRQRAKFKRDMQDRLSDWKKKTKGNRGGLNDMLEDDDRGTAGNRKAARTPRSKSIKPGGSKRPGKNTRQRRGK
eukprot:gene5250-3761_t